MKVKTKTVKLFSIAAIGIGVISLVGCEKIALPQPPVPEFFAETEMEKPTELVVKHISLFRQGVSFDILDNNISRDATGVIIGKDNVKVINDKMIIEKKSQKESIDDFLNKINDTMKNCYTIEKSNGSNGCEIYKLNINESCGSKRGNESSQLLYIYNKDIPDTIIKIEQADKNNSPRADLEQTKVRYESIEFM